MKAQRLRIERHHRAVVSSDALFHCNRYGLRSGSLGIGDDRAFDLPRLQRSVRVVDAVGKGFARVAEPIRLGRRAHHRRGRETDEGEVTAYARHPARDSTGELFVADSLVIERAVRLDVDERDAVRFREGQNGSHLIDDIGFHVIRARIHVPPPKASEVMVARMSAHGNPVFHGEADGAVDDARIARVKAAGHVGRRHELEHRVVIGADAVDAKALPHIAVQIDAHAAIVSLRFRAPKALK